MCFFKLLQSTIFSQQACHLDPMLDDSVMFAKRLRSLGKKVHLDVVDDLPHGFLNFVLVSREAKQASDLCVERIRQILQLDHLDLSEYEILDKDLLDDFDADDDGEDEVYSVNGLVENRKEKKA